MARAKLPVLYPYEYVVILHPTDKERDQGVKDTILAGPSCMMAENPQLLQDMIIKAHLGASASKMDRVDILTRKFVDSTD